MSDHHALEPFLNKDYRDAYLDIRVKAGIAYQIQAIRQALGMSQAEFGALLSKPQSVVSRLEDNEYSGTVKTLLEIAKSLGVGLKVEFCSYPELLAADVSPAQLAVENIDASAAKARDGLMSDLASSGAPIIPNGDPAPCNSVAPIISAIGEPGARAASCLIESEGIPDSDRF